MDNNWYKNLQKSPLNPPNYVFGIAWSILYTLLIISASIIIYNKKYSNMGYFALQIIINLLWTTVFFTYRKIIIAFIMLLIILGLTVLSFIEFYKISKTASYLLLPYMLWLCFASYLNLYIIIYN